MEMKKSQKGVRGSLPGVPKVDEVEKLRRYARRALVAMQAVDAEFKNALALSPEEENTDRGALVVMAAEARLNAFTKLERLNEAKAEAKTTAERERAQERRIEQMAAIKSMARLGFTQDEWNALSPEERAEPSGRPPLALETRVVRAREAYKLAVNNLRAEEKKRGLKKTDLTKVHDPVHDETRPGRKKLDLLGQLDRELAYRNRRLAEMIRTKEHPEEIKVTLSKYSVPTGRKRIPILERIRAEKEEIKRITQLIAQKEAELDAVGLIDRKLKLFRNLASARRLELKRAPSNRRAAISQQLEGVEAQINLLLQNRQKLLSGKTGSSTSGAKAETARKAQIREEERLALEEEERRLEESFAELKRRQEELKARKAKRSA